MLSDPPRVRHAKVCLAILHIAASALPLTESFSRLCLLLKVRGMENVSAFRAVMGTENGNYRGYQI